MAAATWRHHFPDDVEFFEAFAIYEGLKMAKLIGIYPFIIKLDSQKVINLITSKLSSWSEIGWLVHEIQDLAKDVPNVG